MLGIRQDGADVCTLPLRLLLLGSQRHLKSNTQPGKEGKRTPQNCCPKCPGKQRGLQEEGGPGAGGISGAVSGQKPTKTV